MQPHSITGAVVIPAAAGIAALYAIHSFRQYRRAQPAAPASPATQSEQAPAAEVQAQQSRQCLGAYSVQLHIAVFSGDASAVRCTLADAPQAATLRYSIGGATFLHTAAAQGSVKVMQLLVEAAPSTLAAVDSARRSALHTAASSGNEQAVRWLLQAAPQLAVIRDEEGMTAMHAAATSPEGAAIVQQLAESFPALAVITDSRGRTPLHVAAYWNRGGVSAIRALLELAPQTATAIDSYGQTPLHKAAALRSFSRDDQVASLRMLFEAAPAAACMRDSLNRTPLELLLGNPSGRDLARDQLGVCNPLATLLLLRALQLLRASHQPTEPALAARLAACLPLSAFEWDSLPAACLAAALPAALAHSPAQARLLVAHLLPANAARLRTLALCLARLQRTAAAPLPLPLLRRILAQAGSMLY